MQELVDVAGADVVVEAASTSELSPAVESASASTSEAESVSLSASFASEEEATVDGEALADVEAPDEDVLVGAEASVELVDVDGAVVVLTLVAVDEPEDVEEDGEVVAEVEVEVLVDVEASDELIPSTVVPMSPKRMLLNTTVASGCSEMTSSGTPVVVAHVPRATPGLEASAVTG